MNKIHLQGIGKVMAIPVSELRVGMFLSWNYTYKGYQCIGIKDVSPNFVEITEMNLKTGEKSNRRLKKSRLIAASEYPSMNPGEKD